MLPVLGVIGAGAAKGVVAKKITSGVKSKITKVSKDKLLGRGGQIRAGSTTTHADGSITRAGASMPHSSQEDLLHQQILLVEIHFSQSINH